MIKAGLRRLATVTALAAAFATVVGLVLTLLLKLDVRRGVAVGFYLCGVGLCGMAVLLSSRPPVRGSGTSGFIGLGRWAGGRVRWATRHEQNEAINGPGLLLVIGVLLIFCGIAVDDRR